MTRLLLILLPLLLLMAVVLSIRACQKDPPGPAIEEDKVADLVALRDGATMLAPRGTVGRNLVDWLADHDSAQKSFELGGHQFAGRSSEPTPESLGRIPRFVSMLHANPDVRAVLIGHTDASGDPRADLALGRQRAEALAWILEDQGIAKEQLRIETQGSANPVAPNDSEAQRAKNQRVTLILVRED
ncbi:OmpA family protein [Sphingopyxis sp. LARHCG72]